MAEVGERCSRCLNKELAERLNVDVDNTPIAPIVVTDVEGVRHQFAILGDFETDARDLFQLLRERIRQGLAVRHAETTEHG